METGQFTSNVVVYANLFSLNDISPKYSLSKYITLNGSLIFQGVSLEICSIWASIECI